MRGGRGRLSGEGRGRGRPVAILVGEDVGTGVGDGATETGEEDHVLGAHGDEVGAAVLLLGSLLAVPVDLRR
jgi:hypothetical protein